MTAENPIEEIWRIREELAAEEGCDVPAVFEILRRKEKKHDERVRMWTQKRGDLFVITGAVFDWDGNGVRDPDAAARRVMPSNRVAIPSHFYKIIIKKKTFGANDTIAILLPHDDVKHTGQAWEPWITSHITTIGEIQRVTGIDFLPGMSGAKRTEIENFKAPALWPKE